MDKKLSLRKAAEITGISHPYLSQLETGSHTKPSVEILDKLAEGLGIHGNYLSYLAGYLSIPRVELDPTLTEEEKDQKIWELIHEKPGGFYYDPSDTPSLSQYLSQHKYDKNKLLQTVKLAHEHDESLPVIVNKENKVNIKVYKEDGKILNPQDTRELNALIQGFLYGKKFISEKLEEDAFEDAYNDEDKHY